MVAVTVQPYTPAMGAQRRTFVLAVLLNQIVADKDLAMVVAQSFLRFHHRLDSTIWSNRFHLPRYSRVPTPLSSSISHQDCRLIRFHTRHIFTAPRVCMLSSIGSSFISPMTKSFSFLSSRSKESVSAFTCLAACTRTGDFAPREGQ